MNLNTIELKEFLIPDLYHGNLVDSPGYRRPASFQPIGPEEARPPHQATASSPVEPAASTATASSPVEPAASTATEAPATATSSPAAAASTEASPATALSPAEPAASTATAAANPSTTTSSAETASSPSPTSSPASSPAATFPATASPAEYKILGNNRRKISIVVSSPGIAFLPDDQLNFLGKMLEACRMNMGDVAIVNHAAAPIRIATLKLQLQPAFMLLFGTGPVDIGLPMDFPMFKLQQYDQCVYLTAPSLGDMLVPGDESKMLKSKLWISLKTMFGI